MESIETSTHISHGSPSALEAVLAAAADVDFGGDDHRVDHFIKDPDAGVQPSRSPDFAGFRGNH